VAADARGRLWKYLQGLLPAGCHATRIENGIGAGFPDVHYTYLEHSGTIELKSADRLPMKKAGLRKSQIDWIKEEVEAGGTVWVVIQFKSTIYVVNGLYAERINDHFEDGLQDIAAAIWSVRAYEPGILDSILLNKA
jgi:hypothetical protein